MIIHLNKSKMFTVDPAKRFAREYDLPEELWTLMWRKYKLNDYSISELKEYFQMKAGRRIKNRDLNRWIFRTEIYSRARPVMKEGVRSVNSAFFGSLEQRVINEIIRHMKYSGSKDSRIMA